MVTGLRLDHVGYAVPDLESYLESFVWPLLRPNAVSQIIDDPMQHVRLAFVELAGGGRLEIITASHADSPVHGILTARRGGLYHVGYLTDNLQTEIERFRGIGCLLISGPTPAVAFRGRPIAFLYTPQFDLVELIQAESVDTRGLT